MVVFFFASFSNTSNRGNPRVPSGLCSLHVLPSLFDSELTLEFSVFCVSGLSIHNNLSTSAVFPPGGERGSDRNRVTG